MRKRRTVAAAIATLTILTLIIALPAITAPAMAVNIPIASDNQQEQSADSLNMMDPWHHWFDNATRAFHTNRMMFNFSSNVSGVFTHRNMVNTRFGLNFAKLIEFNDTDDNGCFNNETDHVLEKYNLITDVDWESINITWYPLNPSPEDPLQNIQIIITGEEKTGAFDIAFGIKLFFETETIQFNNTNITVPSEMALKFELNITDYQWQSESPENPYSSRYLALVITLHSRVGDSNQYRYRWANGAVVANGSSGLVPSLIGKDVSEVQLVDSFGIPVAEFSWFNGAYNSTHDPCEGCSTFCLCNETMNISIAFAHDDFPDGNIYIDPYFALLEPNYLPLMLRYLTIYQYYENQAMSTQLLYGGVIAAVILIGIIVVLARRR